MVYLKTQHSLEEIQSFIRKEKNVRKVLRLQAIKKVLEGQSPEQIGKDLGYNYQTIKIWIRRYNREGITGLEPRYVPRKPPLSEKERERFCQRIEQGPLEQDGIVAFRGKDIKNILENEFGKVRSLSAIYHLLHSLGYEPLMPRPKHYKANKKEQEEFKKKFQKKLKKLR